MQEHECWVYPFKKGVQWITVRGVPSSTPLRPRLYDVYLPRQAQMLKSHDPAYFEKILRAHIIAPALHPL